MSRNYRPQITEAIEEGDNESVASDDTMETSNVNPSPERALVSAGHSGRRDYASELGGAYQSRSGSALVTTGHSGRDYGAELRAMSGEGDDTAGLQDSFESGDLQGLALADEGEDEQKEDFQQDLSSAIVPIENPAHHYSLGPTVAVIEEGDEENEEEEGAIVPLETSITPYALGPGDRALALRESSSHSRASMSSRRSRRSRRGGRRQMVVRNRGGNRSIVPADQIQPAGQIVLVDDGSIGSQSTSVASRSKGSTKGWENYDQKSITSETTEETTDKNRSVAYPNTVGDSTSANSVRAAYYEPDEASLTTDDLYSMREKKKSKKDGRDHVGAYEYEEAEDLTRKKEEDITRAEDIQYDKFDDDTTINTYGDNFWTSRQQRPQKGVYEAQEPSLPVNEPFPERDIERGRAEPPMEQKMDTSWRSGRSSTSGSSGSGSSRPSSSDRSSDRSSWVGVLQRPGSSRGSHRDESREVEVSMDGFMHQTIPSDHSRSTASILGSASSQPLLVGIDDKTIKLSRVYKSSTLLTVCGLLTTILFFTAHMGPFYVQPATKSTGEGGQSSALAVEPQNHGESSALLAINNTTSSALIVTDIPDWASKAFLNWRRSYVGSSSEVPVVWALEKSGDDIVAETISQCLSKVIAGDGKKYDVNNEHTSDWLSDSFKVLRTNGRPYLNVDLFSLEGLNRAGNMALAQSRVSDLIYTPFMRDSAVKLFSPPSGQDKPDVSGRLMIIFRNPIDRALNRYEATRLITGNDAMSLAEYANHPIYSENNPLTRALLGLGPSDPLGPSQTRVAQELLNNFVLVGLYEKMDASFVRLTKFLHWYPGVESAQMLSCQEQVRGSFRADYQISTTYFQSDPFGYNMVAASHNLDRLIYKFAEALYELQGNVLVKAGNN